MKKMNKTKTIFFLSSLILFLITGCDNDDTTSSSVENRCSVPNISEIHEDHLLDMNNSLSVWSVISPIFVTWGPEKRILQIYLNNELITQYSPQCPGVEISLEDNQYEFKLWKEGSATPETSLWVDVVKKIEYVHEDGLQFDESEWITIPGDACEPMIADYENKYSNYVSLNNSIGNFSQLVAHADLFKADSDPGEYTHRIHNITYLKKSHGRITKGVHTASFEFQIPDLDTGRTVEGGLFIWIGHENIRLDYGTAFQWILEKNDPKYKKLYYWKDEEWIDSQIIVPLYNNYFYKVTFEVNIDDRDASLTFEGKENTFTFNNIFSQTKKNDLWTDKTVARFQAECISQNGTKHRVNFKNYKWTQNILSQGDIVDVNEENFSLPTTTVTMKKQTMVQASNNQNVKEMGAVTTRRNKTADIWHTISYEKGCSDNNSKFSPERPISQKAHLNERYYLKDHDKDGVIDLWDKCPNTPKNRYTDKQGCSFGDNHSDIYGYIQMKNDQSLEGSASLIQFGEYHQKVQIEDNGFFKFSTVNKDKPFSIFIRNKKQDD